MRLGLSVGVLACVLGLSACTQTNGGAGPATSSGGAQQTLPQSQEDKLYAALSQAAADAEAANDFSTAAGMYAKLFAERGNDPHVLAALARNLRYAGNPQESLRVMNTYAGEHAGNVDVIFEHGKALLAGGKRVEALVKLQEARTLDPQSWRIHSAIGIAQDTLSNPESAWAAYETALKLSPGNPSVLNNFAMSRAQAGHIDAAIQMLEQAAGIQRSNPQVRQNLALLYAIKGDVARAKSLAAMDLSQRDLDTNMSFYRRFDVTNP